MSKIMTAWVLLGCGAFSAHAAVLVATGSKAVLTVDYEYHADGNKQDKYDPQEWHVVRKVSIITPMRAEASQGYPRLHAQDAAAAMKSIEKKQEKAVSAQQKMAPMMADMEALVAKCGDDEACLSREVAKYGNSVQMTPELKSAGTDIAVASKLDAARYQVWRATAQSGTYSIEESYSGQTADPDCMGRPNQRCRRTETRKGGGSLPLPPDMKPSEMKGGTSSLEVDSVRKDMVVQLPVPLSVLGYTQVINSDFPGEESGTFKLQLDFLLGKQKTVTTTIPSDLRSLSGTQTYKMTGASGEGGTLTARWSFSLQ